MDYLSGLSPAAVDGLYGQRWTCAALLRALPPLAKQTVLRLLHVTEPLGAGALAAASPQHTPCLSDVASPRPCADELQCWASDAPGAAAAQADALALLVRLRVLLPEEGAPPSQPPPARLALHPTLRRHVCDTLYDLTPPPHPTLPPKLQARRKKKKKKKKTFTSHFYPRRKPPPRRS